MSIDIDELFSNAPERRERAPAASPRRCYLMDCDHDLLAVGQACLACGYIHGVTVECKQRCQALVDPVTLTDAIAALRHWRDHSSPQGGCAHGR